MEDEDVICFQSTSMYYPIILAPESLHCVFYYNFIGASIKFDIIMIL